MERVIRVKGQELYVKAKTLIPGGTQLLSKRPEMFLPDQWPAYYKSAQGIRVTDLDDKQYVDMSMMGIGACVLGYADSDVDVAVKHAIENGSQCTLNAPEEVELAEVLCDLHPWADMVRYARSGGEAVSIAVRIARAHTGKDRVIFCGYHGWSDWYLAANLGDEDALGESLMTGLEPAGVPKGLRGTALPFHYNHLEQFEALVAKYPEQIAAIVMEPQRGQEPEPAFLETIRKRADEIGAVLIFDEITTGFRMTAGGIHLLHNVTPDIAVFAKAISNGYPMAAIIGREEVMQAAQSTFISSTSWTDRIGPVAALATIKKYRENKVEQHIAQIGNLVKQGWTEKAKKHGIALHTSGLPSLAHFSFEYENEIILTTAFVQLMLERGYLAANQFKPSFAHGKVDVEKYLNVVDEVFAILTKAIAQNNVEALLKGPVARRGFYRLA